MNTNRVSQFLQKILWRENDVPNAMMPSLKNVIWWMPFSPVQCKYSSPLELEDQNCLFSARECVDSEDDLLQFWCGNMVKPMMGTPRTGHLVDGLEMYWSYVIFTMICFQKYFIDLCIPSLLFWKPWRRNNQVVLSINWSYF